MRRFYGTCVEPDVLMRSAVAALAAAALFACRGEPPPRDYQNNPPAMTHPPQKKSQTPSANGMPAAAPEPSKGVQGPNVTPKTKLPDQAPTKKP